MVYDDTTVVFSVRVPLRHYVYYRKRLTGEEQERIRQIMKNVFVSLVERHVNVDTNANASSETIKVEIVEKPEIDDDTIVKIKRKLDKAYSELSKCIEEADKLRDENNALKNKISELKKQIQQQSELYSSVQHQQQRILGIINELIYTLVVARKCITDETCDKHKLSMLIEQSLSKTSVNVREEIVTALLNYVHYK